MHTEPGVQLGQTWAPVGGSLRARVIAFDGDYAVWLEGPESWVPLVSLHNSWALVPDPEQEGDDG
jgi:hypothetical protein